MTGAIESPGSKRVRLSVEQRAEEKLRSQLHNDVRLVVIVQRSPVTAYGMVREILLRDRTIEQVASSLTQFGSTLMSFNANRFIITSLVGLNSSNKIMRYCKDATGKTRRYDVSTMTDGFQNNLKTRYWPPPLGADESVVLQTLYETYGSCVNHSALAYYQNAIDLYDTYNAGEVLERASIHPDDRISYNGLIGALVGQLGVHPFITCKRFQRGQSNDQFLHEASVCLNNYYDLIDCPILGEDFCARNEYIIYATWADPLFR